MVLIAGRQNKSLHLSQHNLLSVLREDLLEKRGHRIQQVQQAAVALAVARVSCRFKVMHCRAVQKVTSDAAGDVMLFPLESPQVEVQEISRKPICVRRRIVCRHVQENKRLAVLHWLVPIKQLAEEVRAL